jgi:hypothetical protein
MYEDGCPWDLADLLEGGREQRLVKVKAEKAQRNLALTRLQRKLAAITRDSTPGELPGWAQRKWDPKDYPHLFGGKKAG